MPPVEQLCSETSTTATTLSAGWISWCWSNILDSTNLETVTGEGTDGWLGTWTWSLGHNTTLTSELNVNSIDADGLELFADVDGGKHSSVWGWLFSVSLDLHTTSNARVGFTTRQISNVDESVVESWLDVANTENISFFWVLATSSAWWSVVNNLGFLNCSFFWCCSLLCFWL